MASLQFGRDISADTDPLVSPSPTAPHILIIGGGIIGLTTAWVLLDRGYKVTLVAERWASYSPYQQHRVTSQAAGALWEYPPAVCGHHTDPISLAKSKRWCMIAYHIWDAIAALPSYAPGIRMKPATFFFTRPISSNPALLQKVQEIASSGARGFSHTAELIDHHNNSTSNTPINPSSLADAYQLLSPVIDTDTCLIWLMALIHHKGAVFHTETLPHIDLLIQEPHLRYRFNVDAIVNATGLASLALADDPACYPIRGALLRFRNDGTRIPRIDAAMALPAAATTNNDSIHGSSDNEMTFIVPRNNNTLLLGGFAQPHEWNLDLTLDSPVIQRMRARCEAFLPALRYLPIDEEFPLVQGLRPFRVGNVRVEREWRSLGNVNGTGDERPSRIVHNYGHGGAGWSLSFGCAADVAELVEEALRDLVPEKARGVEL